MLNLFLGNGSGVDQKQYSTKGNKWIVEQYPKINFIVKATIISNCPINNSFNFFIETYFSVIKRMILFYFIYQHICIFN